MKRKFSQSKTQRIQQPPGGRKQVGVRKDAKVTRKKQYASGYLIRMMRGALLVHGFVTARRRVWELKCLSKALGKRLFFPKIFRSQRGVY